MSGICSGTYERDDDELFAIGTCWNTEMAFHRIIPSVYASKEVFEVCEVYQGAHVARCGHETHYITKSPDQNPHIRREKNGRLARFGEPSLAQ